MAEARGYMPRPLWGRTAPGSAAGSTGFCYRPLVFRVLPHDDVRRLEMASAPSRAVGYTASAYLVRDVLVDTGIPATARELARFLDERAAAGAPVRGALLTHAHEDHAGNAALLAERGWDRSFAPRLAVSTVERGQNLIHDGPSFVETARWLRGVISAPEAP